MSRLLDISKTEGPFAAFGQTISFVYRTYVRTRMPSAGFARYAGVKVPIERRVGDWGFGDRLHRSDGYVNRPRYERSLVRALEANVRTNDRVCVVGGGLGVTAVVAAKRSGRQGTVTCFEGNKENCELVRATAKLNDVENITVHHAIIGENIAVYGTNHAERIIPAEQLPDCDVLELDCEGAEINILKSLPMRPRVIIVETHGGFGSPTSQVLSILHELGYQTSDLGIAEPDLHQLCEENDVRVVAAIRRSDERSVSID